jgi:hypothetical protein
MASGGNRTKLREGSISGPGVRHGHTLNACGDLAYFKGALEVGEPWSTESAREERHDFAEIIVPQRSMEVCDHRRRREDPTTSHYLP